MHSQVKHAMFLVAEVEHMSIFSDIPKIHVSVTYYSKGTSIKISSVKTGTGVRQVCCLSPILFEFYSEYFTKLLKVSDT